MEMKSLKCVLKMLLEKRIAVYNFRGERKSLLEFKARAFVERKPKPEAKSKRVPFDLGTY